MFQISCWLKFRFRDSKNMCFNAQSQDKRGILHFWYKSTVLLLGKVQWNLTFAEIWFTGEKWLELYTFCVDHRTNDHLEQSLMFWIFYLEYVQMNNLVTIHDLTSHTIDTTSWWSDCPSATSRGITQGIPGLLSPNCRHFVSCWTSACDTIWPGNVQFKI